MGEQKNAPVPVSYTHLDVYKRQFTYCSTSCMVTTSWLSQLQMCIRDRIYSEAFDTPNMGQAIMNRLVKAAGHQIIRL